MKAMTLTKISTRQRKRLPAAWWFRAVAIYGIEVKKSHGRRSKFS